MSSRPASHMRQDSRLGGESSHHYACCQSYLREKTIPGAWSGRQLENRPPTLSRHEDPSP